MFYLLLAVVANAVDVVVEVVVVVFVVFLLFPLGVVVVLLLLLIPLVFVVVAVILLLLRHLQSCTADAEISVPSVENPELTNVLPLKPGVGQNIAVHASPTARNFFHVLILPSRSIYLNFFAQNYLPTFQLR